MATTITITPENDVRLREMAQREGVEDLTALANAMLAERLAWESQEFEETVAGIERGLQAAAEGRERPFEEYVADVQKRRLARSGNNEH